MGKTERVNHQVECFLRYFVSGHPTHWAKWIPLCEYWYNTNWHSATGKTPFEVSMGTSLATLAYHLTMQLRMVIYNSGYLIVLSC